MSIPEFGRILEEPQAPEFGRVLGEEAVGEETISEAGRRHILRSTARIGETLAGLPGDIKETILDLTGGLIKKLGFPEERVEKAKELVKQIDPFKLPTSKEVREDIVEQVTGEYLKPRGKGEALSDEIISDTVALLVPVGGVKKIQAGTRILRALGTAAGANLAAEGVGVLGGGEKAQTATKLGTMMILGSIRKGGPKKYVNQLYTEAEEAIKGSPKIKVTELRESLRKLEKGLKKGLEAPSEKAVIGKTRALLNKIQGGRIGVDELWASKRSLNEEMAKTLFEAPGKAAKSRARKLFVGMNKEINKELAKYGKKNPSFGRAFKSAEEGYAALQQSNKIGEMLSKKAKYVAKNPLTYIFFPSIAKKAGIALVALPAYKTAQIGYRIAKSPTLRKYYTDVLKAATKENAAAINRSLRKFDEQLEKED